MSRVLPAATPRAPNPVLVVLGRALERALNRAVDLDPDTRARLAAMSGRAITVDFRDILPALRISVEDERLLVGPAFEGTSALRVAATPGALLALALGRGNEGLLSPGRIEIAGDAELARRLEQTASRYAPDFDAAFTGVFGDVIGFQIARALRSALAWSRASASALASDTAEFLTEESRDLVARAELDIFLDDVDVLRERADRLEAGVRRIAAATRNGGA